MISGLLIYILYFKNEEFIYISWQILKLFVWKISKIIMFMREIIKVFDCVITEHWMKWWDIKEIMGANSRFRKLKDGPGKFVGIWELL